ncbi:peptide deformylase [Myxococcota bacterium]
MAVRSIRIWPDPALKAVAAPVEQVNDDVRALVRDLFDTMYQENGIGLAATQIAVSSRVLVIDLDPRGEANNDPELAEDLSSWGFEGPTAFVNPTIVETAGEIVFEEGCLSVPGVTESVSRKDHVIVEAINDKGEPFTLDAHGLFAVAIQHETDHLDGKVFVDYLSKLKRDVIRRKMERLKVELEEKATGAATGA